MPYELWMLAAMDQAGYNGLHNEHIEAVAQELLCTGLTQIDGDTFNVACRCCGIAHTVFTQADLNKLENMINSM